MVKLKQLLDNVGSITNDESKEAYALIKDQLWESKRQLIRSKGLCINCRSAEIAYGTPTKSLMIKGDKWLDSLFKSWISPPDIHSNPDKLDIKINGFAINTIQPYLCPDCAQEIQAVIDKIVASRDELKNIQVIRQRNYEIEIINGKITATPEVRYWALCRHFHPSEALLLKKLPYKDFLNTIYWSIVRDYVVSKRGGKCGVCGNDQNLNVHHKTYKNHGLEHAYLEDLMLLCKICHAKFHDKFVT